MALIHVHNLSKVYRVPEREPGAGLVRNLLHRTYREVEAVRQVSFELAAGEIVGFIGPNGAGKTTTLKMLSGLLYPTSGEVTVAGAIPWERKPEYLNRISMVMGNKSQLMWDIPPLDTFRVVGEIYRVPAPELRQRMDELVELLDLGDLLTKPVRNLSLGERMKCEVAAALLHRPAVLFLDEPTLGLDVSMQRRLRGFIAEYNRRSGATIILTSHYMADVVELCSRLIVIHQGKLIYDGGLQGLVERLAPFKLIRLTVDSERLNGDLKLPEGVELTERQDGNLTVRARRTDAPAATAQLLATLPVIDLAVEEPPIEAVIDQIYQEGGV
ncbi:MAG TPA: ATP-binding cassette domain-containing protein [Phototrophicaceae bacterium]|nr:ATP-binding cassette domain-containing protein [Phototrophicaceae bacterium]